MSPDFTLGDNPASPTCRSVIVTPITSHHYLQNATLRLLSHSLTRSSTALQCLHDDIFPWPLSVAHALSNMRRSQCPAQWLGREFPHILRARPGQLSRGTGHLEPGSSGLGPSLHGYILMRLLVVPGRGLPYFSAFWGYGDPRNRRW